MIFTTSSIHVRILTFLLVLSHSTLGLEADPANSKTWDAGFVISNPELAFNTDPDRAVELAPGILANPTIAEDYFEQNPAKMKEYPDAARTYFGEVSNAVRSTRTYKEFIKLFPDSVVERHDVYRVVIDADISVLNENKQAFNKYISKQFDFEFTKFEGTAARFDAQNGVLTTSGKNGMSVDLYSVHLLEPKEVSVKKNGEVVIAVSSKEGFTLKQGNIKIEDGAVVFRGGTISINGRKTVALPPACDECKVDLSASYAGMVTVKGRGVRIGIDQLKQGTVRLFLDESLAKEISLEKETTIIKKGFGTIHSAGEKAISVVEEDLKLKLNGEKGVIKISLTKGHKPSYVEAGSSVDVTILSEEFPDAEINAFNGKIDVKSRIPTLVVGSKNEKGTDTILAPYGVTYTCSVSSACPTETEQFIALTNIRTIHQNSVDTVHILYVKDGPKITFKGQPPTLREISTVADVFSELPGAIQESIQRKEIQGGLILDDVKDICGEDWIAGCAKDSFFYFHRGALNKKGILHELAHNAARGGRRRTNYVAWIDPPKLETEFAKTQADVPEKFQYRDYSPEGKTEWVEIIQEPRHGCMRVYGCINPSEDVATYVEAAAVLKDREFWRTEGVWDPRYERKVNLLCKHNFLTPDTCTTAKSHILDVKRQLGMK